MFLAESINDTLESKKSKLVGWNGYYTIVSVLNRAFGQKDLKFKLETFDYFEKDDYSVSGLYDMNEDKKYIILNFSSRHIDITLQPYDWNKFKFLVSQVIQHETIHQFQWTFREPYQEKLQLDFRNFSGSKEEEKLYLSELDEIDAYAHDIAMEIKFFYPKRDPYDVLRNINKSRKLWSYFYYKKTFRGDEWQPIKSRLLKKTFKWLPYVTV
jgi:hypothetical protein